MELFGDTSLQKRNIHTCLSSVNIKKVTNNGNIYYRNLITLPDFLSVFVQQYNQGTDSFFKK